MPTLVRRTVRALVFLVRFLGELALANWQVTRAVLRPTLRIRPGFVSIPLDATSDFEITAFANAITLTPGTISVYVPDDRHAIVIHTLDVGDDVDALRASIKSSLEEPILRVTRG